MPVISLKGIAMGANRSGGEMAVKGYLRSVSPPSRARLY